MLLKQSYIIPVTSIALAIIFLFMVDNTAEWFAMGYEGSKVKFYIYSAAFEVVAMFFAFLLIYKKIMRKPLIIEQVITIVLIAMHMFFGWASSTSKQITSNPNDVKEMLESTNSLLKGITTAQKQAGKIEITTPKLNSCAGLSGRSWEICAQRREEAITANKKAIEAKTKAVADMNANAASATATANEVLRLGLKEIEKPKVGYAVALSSMTGITENSIIGIISLLINIFRFSIYYYCIAQIVEVLSEKQKSKEERVERDITPPKPANKEKEEEDNIGFPAYSYPQPITRWGELKFNKNPAFVPTPTPSVLEIKREDNVGREAHKESVLALEDVANDVESAKATEESVKVKKERGFIKGRKLTTAQDIADLIGELIVNEKMFSTKEEWLKAKSCGCEDVFYINDLDTLRETLALDRKASHYRPLIKEARDILKKAGVVKQISPKKHIIEPMKALELYGNLRQK